MKYSNENYPWPVLTPSNDDFIECSFSLEAEGIDKGNFFLFDLKYSLNAEGIVERIKSGEAVVVVRVESPAAMFRVSHQFAPGETSCELKISKDDIAKTITFIPQVIASEDLGQYLPSGCNPLYFSLPFSIEKGNVLAVGSEVKYYLDASELEKPISSIMTIDENENAESTMTVNFDGDRISILLDRETHTLYKKLAQTVAIKQFLINTVVLPTLVEALHLVQLSDDDGDDGTYANLRWFRAIEAKLNNMGIDREDLESHCLTDVANALLGESVRKSFRSIEDFMKLEAPDNE